MKPISILFFVILFHFTVAGQNETTIYPTHWWVNMKNPKLQLLVRGKQIGDATKVDINYPGVKVEKISRFENKNYLAIDLNISTAAKPGSFKINVKIPGNPLVYNYERGDRAKELFLHRV
jgi:neopullulanase